MKKTLGYLQKIENGILIAAFAGMVICSFLQVVNRNFVKAPIAWFDEVALYCMIYMALLGTEAGLRDGTQISITAIMDKLQDTPKKICAVLARIVVVAFSGNTLYWSIKMVGAQHVSGQVTSALGIPMTIPYMALLLSFLIITLVQLFMLIIQIRDWNSSREGSKV